MKLRGWLLVGLAACGDPPPVHEELPLTSGVGASDVSILFPIPEARSQRTSLIGADEAGERGLLLPRSVYGALPALHTTQDNDEVYGLLRVVGVRLDPCFPGLGVPDEASCANQIRLVLQPVILATEGNGLTTMDLAVHLFYAIDREELADLLQRLVDLRERAGDEPTSVVGVHPTLAREGVEGAFAKDFRLLLLSHAGEENLTRITFMGTEQVGLIWRFGGFDVTPDAVTPIDIAGVDSSEQIFHNGDFAGLTFDDAYVSPPGAPRVDLGLLIRPDLAASATEDERLDRYAAAVRIENPEHESPATVDCVSCHIAAAVRAFAERTYGPTIRDVEDEYAPDAAPIDGATVEQTNELRAFGYFGDELSISQRAANETDAVVRRVNATVRQ